MVASAIANVGTAIGLCNACGVPLDSQYFDDSSVRAAPKLGDEVVLARFELPAQYCGVLQYFGQYTDAFGSNAAAIVTPTIEWRLLVNNHALFPYINLRRIINPWGFGSYQVNLRLDEDSTIEMVARGVTDDQLLKGIVTSAVDENINVVGGRIVGRFWYNECYGGR